MSFLRCRWLLSLCLLVLLAPALHADTKPNFVVLLCDDLGYGDLGCFGHPHIQTPHLDRLAGQGVKFTHCYSSAPVCSPSRAGLMTSRNPNRLGIRDWIPPNSGIFLKKDETTIAKLLRSAGYRTCLAGKWHLNSKMDGSEPTPGDHGFDHWFATQNNAAPSHENPVNFIRNGQKVGKVQGNSSTLCVDEAIRFLDETKDKPFALFVCFHAPHEPVATPKEFTDKYLKFEPPEKRIYYGSVSLVDHEVGRLMKYLDETKLADNTLVLFTSDNRPETLKRYKGAERSYGSPGELRGMKLWVTEGGYRVPGILRWPGHAKPGQASSEPICNVDVLPTFCAAAGIKLPEIPLDGASLLPLLDGKPVVRKVPLYWQYDKAIGTPYKLSVRVGDWKLLADAKLEQFALFNLGNDTKEAQDQSQQNPAKLNELKAALRKMHQEINP